MTNANYPELPVFEQYLGQVEVLRHEVMHVIKEYGIDIPCYVKGKIDWNEVDRIVDTRFNVLRNQTAESYHEYVNVVFPNYGCHMHGDTKVNTKNFNTLRECAVFNIAMYIQRHLTLKGFLYDVDDYGTPRDYFLM